MFRTRTRSFLYLSFSYSRLRLPHFSLTAWPPQKNSDGSERNVKDDDTLWYCAIVHYYLACVSFFFYSTIFQRR